MSLMQMLLAAGGLRNLGGLYWTTKAGNPAPFTTVSTTTQTGTTGSGNPLPAGTLKIICFTGYGANHQYVEMTIAQWNAAYGYGATAQFTSGPFYMQLLRNTGALMYNASDGTSGNSTGVTADTSKLFPGADGTNAWAVLEFWG